MKICGWEILGIRYLEECITKGCTWHGHGEKIFVWDWDD